MSAKVLTPEALGRTLVEETPKGWLYKNTDGTTQFYNRSAYPDGKVTITVFDSHDMEPLDIAGNAH